MSITRLRHSTTDADLERLGPIVRRAADAIADAARLRDIVEQRARPSGADSTALGRCNDSWKSSMPSRPATRPALNSPDA